MEWDEVEVFELLQKFESSSVSSLVELRQEFLRNTTSRVNHLKELIANLRIGFADGIRNLKEVNEHLSGKLKQTEDVLHGKEIEILGLRHQLRSLLVSKPLCHACSVQVVAPELSLQTSDIHLLNSQSREKNSILLCERKRTFHNASISTSMDSTATKTVSYKPSYLRLYRRPSEKRRCLSDLHRKKFQLTKSIRLLSDARRPKILVAETQNVNLEDRAEASPVHADISSQSMDELVLSSTLSNSPTHSVQSAPTLTAEHVEASEDLTSSCQPVHLNSFSPPTQVYDASRAIRGAVNHADLENQTFASSRIDLHRMRLSARTVTEHSKKRSPARSGHAHRHKPNCRHYRTHHRFVDKQSESDITGADLTLPSELLVSDATAVHPFSSTEAYPPPAVVEGGRAKIENADTINENVLPSIGGSPTKDVFKEPLPINSCDTDRSRLSRISSVPATQDKINSKRSGQLQAVASESVSVFGQPMTCGKCKQYFEAAGYSAEEVMERLRASKQHYHEHQRTAPSSTPDGFWRLELSSVAPIEPGNDENAVLRDSVKKTSDTASMVAIREGARRLRRRRPLEYPNCYKQ